jgi:hypothetical protein
MQLEDEKVLAYPDIFRVFPQSLLVMSRKVTYLLRNISILFYCFYIHCFQNIQQFLY